MRYYEEKYPEVDDLVMVTVKQIADMGAYVKLVSHSSLARLYSLRPSSLLVVHPWMCRVHGRGGGGHELAREIPQS